MQMQRIFLIVEVMSFMVFVCWFIDFLFVLEVIWWEGIPCVCIELYNGWMVDNYRLYSKYTRNVLQMSCVVKNNIDQENSLIQKKLYYLHFAFY